MSTTAQPETSTPATPAATPATGAETPNQPGQAGAQAPLTDDQKRLEDVRKATSFLASKILKGEKPSPPPKKSDEGTPPSGEQNAAPPAGDKEKQATPPEEEQQPPKRKKSKKEPDVSRLTAEDTARIAATAAAEVVARKTAEPPQKPQDEPVVLPDEFEAERPIYERMEAEKPEKYKGLVKELASYAKLENDYIQKWIDENPGMEYDPNSNEHDEFYRRHQPAMDPEDIEAAKESLREAKIRAQVLQEISPELNEIRTNKAIQAAAPKFQAAAQGVITDVLEGINPEYAKVATDREKLNQIGEEDPIAADVGQSVVNKYVTLATEAVALHNGIPFNSKNPAHMDTFYRVLRIEDSIKALPPGEQVYEGRRFATREEYGRMSPEMKRSHWTVGEESVLYDIRLEAKREAEAAYKAAVEQHERYSKRKGKTPATNGAPPPQPAPAPPAQRSSAPSIVPAPAVTPGSGSPSGQSKSGLDRFHERLVGAR